MGITQKQFEERIIDIHEKVIRTDERVSILDKRFEKFEGRLYGDLKENDQRISKIENWKAYVIGISATVAFLISAGIAVARYLI